TVIVEPNSWAGKELLSQTKRLIDLQRDVHSLSTLINHLSKKVDDLGNQINKSTQTWKGEYTHE
ncbi:hypothetical protein ABNC92_20600, partial [Paenibacillus larvae]